MIRCKNLTLKYKQKSIFKDLSLDIDDRERLVVVGESGVGKSTLLRVIAGFTPLDSGEIYIDKQLVTKDRDIIVPPNRRGIGMIFQDLALWPHLDVQGNIAFGLKIKRVPKYKRKEIVEETLNMVGLQGYENRNIDRLSGGEQQRVALARTLALSPKTILMDEPLSSLDKAQNIKLRREIIRLQKDLKFTLVYVTHNEDEVEEIATERLYLN